MRVIESENNCKFVVFVNNWELDTQFTLHLAIQIHNLRVSMLIIFLDF